eukprot:GHVS01067621.1.p1 GENE.GHVS01067621.1~~GHVS01067621.1.p1  ORF type:complete len:413 (+),score=39.48 GHVS01067621.1:122-1240(+)
MVLVGLLPKDRPLLQCTWSDWKKGLLLSSLDVVNQLLKKAGLVFAGAGVYIIVESSSMVWTVLWSKLLLQKKLNFGQWISILLVTAGIALRACQLTFHIENEEFVGVILILASSILMGLTFVLFEMFVNHPTEAVPGPTLVFMMGITCALVMTGWQIVWTVPRFDELVMQTIHKKRGNPWYVLMCYIFLLVSGWIHSATLWYLLKVMGAVSSGVLKGLKVAGVFVLSHVLFCEIQPSQCLNIWSGASATICTLGVIVYSIVTASSSIKSAAPKWMKHGDEDPGVTAPLLDEEQRSGSPSMHQLSVCVTNDPASSMSALTGLKHGSVEGLSSEGRRGEDRSRRRGERSVEDAKAEIIEEGCSLDSRLCNGRTP